MALDEISQKIVEIVKEWNRSDREICFTDLKEMGIAAPPTIQKKIVEMLGTEDLIGHYVQTPHGTKRILFVPEAFATSAESTVIIRQNGMLIYELRRIADCLEMATTDRSGGIYPKKRSDGKAQTRLWTGAEQE